MKCAKCNKPIDQAEDSIDYVWKDGGPPLRVCQACAVADADDQPEPEPEPAP